MHKLVKRTMRFTLKYHYLAQHDCYTGAFLKGQVLVGAFLEKYSKAKYTHSILVI
jgi:hypothetical protein